MFRQCYNLCSLQKLVQNSCVLYVELCSYLYCILKLGFLEVTHHYFPELYFWQLSRSEYLRSCSAQNAGRTCVFSRSRCRSCAFHLHTTWHSCCFKVIVIVSDFSWRRLWLLIVHVGLHAISRSAIFKNSGFRALLCGALPRIFAGVLRTRSIKFGRVKSGRTVSVKNAFVLVTIWIL